MASSIGYGLRSKFNPDMSLPNNITDFQFWQNDWNSLEICSKSIYVKRKLTNMMFMEAKSGRWVGRLRNKFQFVHRCEIYPCNAYCFSPIITKDWLNEWQLKLIKYDWVLFSTHHHPKQFQWKNFSKFYSIYFLFYFHAFWVELKWSAEIFIWLKKS